MKPTPMNLKFYDFLADEALAWFIANKQLRDIDTDIHSDIVKAFRKLSNVSFEKETT